MKLELIKKTKYLFLSSAIAIVGLGEIPALAQVSEPQLNAFVEALKLAAPPNKPNDGMYSDWQILPGIIPSWTKQCLGKETTPAAFEADKNAAKKTVACIMQRELNKQMKETKNNEKLAVRQTACWWMTGKTNGCSSGATASYVQKVEGFYQKQLQSSR